MNRHLQLAAMQSKNKMKYKYTGEITGSFNKMEDIEQGMPYRSQVQSRKDQKNYDKIIENNYMDFSIFEEDNNIGETNINYFDNTNNNYSNISDIADPVMNKGIMNGITNIFNDFAWYIFSGFQKYNSENNYIIAPYYIINLFGFLYIASKNNTEIEIRNYFNFPDRNNLFNTLNSNMKYLEKTSLSQHNILLANDKIRINDLFVNYCNKFINIINYNSRNIENEVNKINEFLGANIIKSHYLTNKNLVYFMYNQITTNFNIKFNNLLVTTFYGLENKERYQEYIVCNERNSSMNQSVIYYTDNIIEIIELKMKDNVLSMGIIIGKGNEFPEFNNNTMNKFIEKLKPKVFDNIIIPKFTQNHKFIYDNILKKSGLETVFNSLDVPELLMNKIPINNIYQFININITSQNIEKKISKITNENMFIANCPFIYYFRMVPTNTIIFIGQYI